MSALHPEELVHPLPDELDTHPTAFAKYSPVPYHTPYTRPSSTMKAITQGAGDASWRRQRSQAKIQNQISAEDNFSHCSQAQSSALRQEFLSRRCRSPVDLRPSWVLWLAVPFAVCPAEPFPMCSFNSSQVPTGPQGSIMQSRGMHTTCTLHYASTEIPRSPDSLVLRSINALGSASTNIRDIGQFAGLCTTIASLLNSAGGITTIIFNVLQQVMEAGKTGQMIPCLKKCELQQQQKVPLVTEVYQGRTKYGKCIDG